MTCVGKGSWLSQAQPSSLKDLREGRSLAPCSAILRTERGRLKPTDGAGLPRPCAGSLAPASRSLSRFSPRRVAGRKPAGPPPLCVPLSEMAGCPAGQGSSTHLGPLPRASSLPLGGIRRVATAAGAMTSAEGSFASTEIFMP